METNASTFISQDDNITYILGDTLRVELNDEETTITKAARHLGVSINWINKMFLKNNFENKLEFEFKGNKVNLGLYGVYETVKD